ncbi:tetraacyldisaccharide 4'-kinase [Altibacter sp. HG106]|uniref:tetraacyldisaccharide 4'-kinase n=1 Tax=Altibacter sp. HG106 TaxID=3023937 RepID=UPI00234FFABF|nr:tetraacyldisaccharide 4'-kinase [Altibacter sp. HG106]MDC7995858.1 tetraacyldisaccharide 4'-kinase [Altibacter sp. HG106]
MKLLRQLLFPFSLVYGGVIWLRNKAYDWGWFSSSSYQFPVVCVGNLSVGGTGKSPMIAYLLSFLQEDFEVAVLSRGYGRKTKGYVEVTLESTAEEVGDEPLQCKQNFPETTVAVCADRRKGISMLRPNTDVILLDDAFQHRRVQASLNIVLTSYDDLYIEDSMLPTGNLREPTSGIRRADIVVVTKCPPKVPYATLQELQFRLGLAREQSLFFAAIGYDQTIYGSTETQPLQYLRQKKFTLVTGIAKPEPLVVFLQQHEFSFDHWKFPDHHTFSAAEIKKIQEEDIVLTTEKDFMRLQGKVTKFALYYLPIKTVILNDQETNFQNTVLQKMRNL